MRQPPRVLHVSDNEAWRVVVGRMLRDADFDVIEQTNGEALLNGSCADQDLVVLDGCLRARDPLEFCRFLRGRIATSRLPIVLVSASPADSRCKALGLNSGADAYLSAPIERELLSATIHAVLRARPTDFARDLADMKRLHELGIRLLQEDELTALLHQVLQASIELLGADKGNVQLYDEQEGVLRLVTYVGFDRRFADAFPSIPAGFGTCGTALVQRKRVIVEDVFTDPVFSHLATTFASHGFVALQSTPLFGGDGKLFGMLTTHFCRPHRSSDRELRLLDLYAQQAERVIERKRAEEALRQSEQRLRLALDAGRMGSWDWNLLTGEIKRSENWDALSGLAPESASTTFDAFRARIHVTDRDRVLETIARSIEQRADYEADFRTVRPDGSMRWMLAKGRLFTNEHEQPVRMIGVTMDITERKEAEEAIQAAGRRKDEFLAMLSHELRNPLSAIFSALTLLERVGSRDTVELKARAILRRQTDQLGRLVDDLLDVARLTTGKLILTRKRLDLAAMVERCVNDLVSARRLDQHHYGLRTERAHVDGDLARLEQVITNLLTNAVKYTPAGGTIDVEVAPEGEEAVLRVRDTGIGISRELLPRVFDLFVQSERELDRRQGGLGIGLTLVQRLIEAHGGLVEAHSAGPDCGSQFVVRLPLVAAPTARSEPPRVPVRHAHRRRVLLVDDNVDAREPLLQLLELAGHEVHEAGDGQDGIEAALRLHPDAVLIDIGLPGLDGFEVARRLKAKKPGLRLVALTGYGQLEDRRRGAEAGFDAYLVKPVELDAVLRALLGE